jgi:cell volume regulation protein A
VALVGGSGFLAVYVAGVWAGNVRMRHQISLRRFSNGVTWLAQIAMFLLLGLLATPSEFASVLVPATALSLILILVARPIAIWACLIPFGSAGANGVIAWVACAARFRSCCHCPDPGRVAVTKFITFIVDRLAGSSGWSIGQLPAGLA